MYDIIGDIHGHADALTGLLDKLGYRKNSENIYCHPDRKIIFAGDFIDRGKQNIEVLQIVMPMVQNGHALAVMGNHEFNAICFHTKHPDTEQPLRPHTEKNVGQHSELLKEFSGKDDYLRDVIAWFKTLPLFLDLDGLRVVHAEWSSEYIDELKERGNSGKQFLVDDAFIVNASIKGTAEHQIVETLLKGSEISLPENYSFKDKDGNIRSEIRFRWWLSSGTTYRDVAMLNEDQLHEIPDLPLPEISEKHYPSIDKPVFFGHYWMVPPTKIQSHNAICVDYSVAKGGVLCGYQWDGERHLLAGKIINTSSR